MSDRKYIDIKEFRETGFLQEANRLFFHPHGLALEVVVEDDGSEHLGGVWDSRDDPEGVWFAYAETPDGEYAQTAYDKGQAVQRERERHCEARSNLFDKRYASMNRQRLVVVRDIEPIPWPDADQ